MATTILVLNTQEGDLDRLVQSLKEAAGKDARVEVVRTAKEVLERLRSGLLFDLVVVDYFLGDGSGKGIDVIRQIREHNKALPVVAVAENGDVESADKAIEAHRLPPPSGGGR